MMSHNHHGKLTIRTGLAGCVQASDVPPSTYLRDDCTTFGLSCIKPNRSVYRGQYSGIYTYRHLIYGPHVQIDGLDFTDMRTHRPMDTRTTNAKEYSPAQSHQHTELPVEKFATHRFQEAHRGSVHDLSLSCIPVMTRVRTVSLTVRAHLVLRVLQHLPEHLCVSLRRGFILLRRHGGSRAC